MTKGMDKETLDGINVEWFIETSKKLREESWHSRPARRVYIPKANGKLRPLGISSPRDKIVQQAMKLVLEAVIEPRFSDLSHGFRPNRGCHTALKEIRSWKGVSWFVEGNIKGFFDNIDHHILVSLINKHFSDKRLVNLYWKFVKAGYIEWDSGKNKYVNSDLGVPQGGIVSPLLSNLMLHEFDLFMERMIKEQESNNKKLKPHITNPRYHSLTMRINRLKDKINLNHELSNGTWNDRLNLSKLIKERRRLKSIIPNPGFVRIKYVRYADDWLVGLWGNVKTARLIKESARDFLAALKLELSEEKTLITNAREDRAKFLGTFIKRLASSRSVQYYKNGKGHSQRVPTGNLWMSAPILETVKRLEDKDFLERKGYRWVPKSIGSLTLLPVQDIIMRYNSIMNGIANYYSFMDNRRYLRKISWILQESLRKTIGRKLKISKKAFLLRFGKAISMNICNKVDGNNKTIRYTQIDYTRKPMLFYGGTSFKDPISPMIFKVSTISHLGMVCASCGSTSNIEMHHLKHIKTINSKLKAFDKMMAEINRKQVPLCRTCHLDVHKGNYEGKSLKNLNKIWVPVENKKEKNEKLNK